MENELHTENELQTESGRREAVKDLVEAIRSAGLDCTADDVLDAAARLAASMAALVSLPYAREWTADMVIVLAALHEECFLSLAREVEPRDGRRRSPAASLY